MVSGEEVTSDLWTVDRQTFGADRLPYRVQHAFVPRRLKAHFRQVEWAISLSQYDDEIGTGRLE